jgi:hypothetical protein
MTKVSASQFESALKKVRRPKGKQLDFLRAHYEAPGRAATATALAKEVGYKSYSAINLQYGILASQVGVYVGVPKPKVKVSLLVDLVRPPSVTNQEWILVMRPEFADGLKRAGWV